MKGKFEDEIAQLAFGELSPKDEARIEREAESDPEALRALSLYKEMRMGLRSLSDIPEDQFSKERLRDAILTQGLRPVAARPASDRGWLWMPLAACVIGFGMMFALNQKHRPPAMPALVLSPHAKSILDDTDLSTKVVSNSPSDFKFGPFERPHAAVEKTADPYGILATHHHKDLNEIDPKVMASVPDPDGGYDPDLGNPSSAQAAADAHTSGHPSTAASTETSSGPIVLIEQDKDEQTGACKATEVGSSSNVLVGG